MSYLRNQPVATDDLSVAAPILATNTNKSDDSFGIDHFQFSDATANNGFHKKVTIPGTGIATPTPPANYGDMFATTTANITQPYWIRDGLATIFNMLPIKAFGSFNGGGGTVNAINMTASRTVGQPVGVFDINIAANAVTGTSYCVLIGVGINGVSVHRIGVYAISSPILTVVSFLSATNQKLDPDFFTVTILQA